MRITATARIQNNAWRYDPETGFLRCTASILREGVMIYQPSDLEGVEIPPGLTESIRLYVSQEQLARPESMATLEGMPVVVGHTWQVAGAMSSCGNMAGAPCIEGSHLVSDILITDPAVVRRVMLPDDDPEKLVEISSAGDWVIVWEPGVSISGQAYDGFFVNITYNHCALLPSGAGRAGASVRIINTKEVSTMEFTKVRLANGKTVRVANEDADELMAADASSAEQVKNAITPEQLNEALEELKVLKGEVGEKNARIAELEGMVQGYKDQLDAALAPEAVEEAAAELANEREEATAVMNSAGLKFEDADKKLRGHDLRAKVVNSVRVKNGKTALTEDQAKDEGYVRGMYATLADMHPSAKKETVTGASVVKVENKGTEQAPNMSNNAERAKRLYGKQ